MRNSPPDTRTSSCGWCSMACAPAWSPGPPAPLPPLELVVFGDGLPRGLALAFGTDGALQLRIQPDHVVGDAIRIRPGGVFAEVELRSGAARTDASIQRLASLAQQQREVV